MHRKTLINENYLRRFPIPIFIIFLKNDADKIILNAKKKISEDLF